MIEVDPQQVTPRAFEVYLSMARWRPEQDADPSERFTVWSAPTDAELTVLIPITVRPDYVRLAGLAIAGIAENEGRAETDVLTDLVHRSHDVLSVRRHTPSSTLGISAAVQMHSALLRLVTAASRATRDLGIRSPLLMSSRPGLADYLDAVRLAPAERGSFVIKALLPWATEHRPTSVLVVNASGVAVRTATAIAAGEQDPESWFDTLGDGVTSGLCSALSQLGGDDGDDDSGDSGDIDLRITWAWSPTGMPAEHDPIIVPKGLCPVLAAGADLLRRDPEEFSVRLVGQIETLHRPGGSVGPGTVRVRGMIEGFGVRTLSFDLDQRSYDEATEAHKARRTTVARALVRREGRQLVVLQSSGFEYSG